MLVLILLKVPDMDASILIDKRLIGTQGIVYKF